MTQSERAALGLTDDQQHVHLLERAGKDWRVRQEWDVAERSHTDVMVHLGRFEEPATDDDPGALRADPRRRRAAGPPPPGAPGAHARSRGPGVVTGSAGGAATLTGDPTPPALPPLRVPGDQSGYQTALNAAIASLGSLVSRLAT